MTGVPHPLITFSVMWLLSFPKTQGGSKRKHLMTSWWSKTTRCICRVQNCFELWQGCLCETSWRMLWRGQSTGDDGKAVSNLAFVITDQPCICLEGLSKRTDTRTDRSRCLLNCGTSTVSSRQRRSTVARSLKRMVFDVIYAVFNHICGERLLCAVFYIQSSNV